MRVAFWGTPEFAGPPLRALLGEDHDVVAVITQPDRPRNDKGRSRSRLDPSAVKLIAREENIPVLQPERPRGAEFAAALRAFEPEISVVVAYGHILPGEIIDLPAMGTVNVHASLLPAYRGAAPIQAAIRDGLSETGVSVMRMVPALDAGPVLLALRTPILTDETAGELQLRLSELGATAIVEALVLLALGKVVEARQDDSLATLAPKIGRADARIPFDAPAERVARLVRAYDPRPGAWGVLRERAVRLFGARVVSSVTGQPGAAAVDDAHAPGEVIAAGDDGVVIACGAGAVLLSEVHPAGQKRLAAADWVRGRGVAVGERFL